MSLQVRNLSYRYPTQTDRAALGGISFDIAQGSLSGLLGPNGSGKSTTFKVLSTQVKVQAGSVLMNGVDVSKQPELVRGFIGVTFQAPSLDPILTVEENLLLHASLYGVAGLKARDRLKAALEAVGITDRQAERVQTLSGGLARRVELAKNLMLDPKILLLDEPTTGLDPRARAEFWAVLSKLQTEKKMTVLVTTHLMEEAEICEHLVFLHNGKVVAQGKPSALKGQLQFEVLQVEWGSWDSAPQRIQSVLNAQETWTKVEGKMRIRTPRGQELFSLIRNQWNADVASLSLGKPTLSDVFFEVTGDKFA